MIKAVIFDCFGVLATDGWLPFRDEHFENNPDLLEQARVHNVRVDSGLISYADFMAWLADVTDVSFADVQRRIEGNVPNEPLFAYIRDQLAPTYQVGMLSNAGANWLDRMFEPWQVSLFDAVVLSYELGVTKPDPVMYETIALKLGVTPEEAVFIDDQPRYVEGAKAVGMQGIHFQNTEQAITELEDVLRA